ncbi:MAG TPA: pitrilysin family protein [Candidatus Saccharimonadales bacterium]|nr:pitrilysin family protein [Candidatus Saccharimonadales bacterium]
MKHRVSELVLDNGAKGLLIHVPDASVMSIYISFRAGDYLAPEDKWETPHLMEHLILDANEEFSRGRDFQADFERNGAYSNASTGTYNITYEAECADFEWQRILQCMVLSITKPLFLKDEFHAEVGNVREELVSRSNNHFQHLSLALRGAYGLRATTYQKRLELVNNVTLQDIIDHYKNTHYSSNMRFVIAGKLNPTRRAKIRAILAGIELPEGTGRKDLPDEKPKGLKRPLYIPNDTVDNLYFYFDTFMKRRMSDSELHAMSLINSMLTETLHSQILGTARERGLVYSMSSNIAYDSSYTNWWFGAQVQPKNARGLFDIIIEELEKLFNGKISVADLKAAKQYRLGRFQRSAQTVSGIASGYMWRYFFEDVVEDYLGTPKHIKAVTKNQIVEGSRELFAEKNWGLGILGRNDRRPANRLAEQLSVLWK